MIAFGVEDDPFLAADVRVEDVIVEYKEGGTAHPSNTRGSADVGMELPVLNRTEPVMHHALHHPSNPL